MAVDADAAVNDAALLMAEARRDVALLSDGE
jgi:hypothetical protein